MSRETPRDLRAAPVARSAQKARSRARLIRSALAVIGREGLSGTTVAKVALEAGASQGLVNFHFESKDQLLLAALNQLVNRYRDDCRKALEIANGSASERLDALIIALLRHAEDRVCLAGWFAFWGDASARTLYKDVGGPADRETEQLLIGLGKELFEGRGRNKRARAFAEGVIAQVNGHWVCKLMRPHEVSLQHGIESCRRFVGLLLDEPSSRHDNG